MNQQKWTAAKIKALKGKSPFPCLTAYDCATASLLDEAGIPLVLVGDSLGMAVLGYDSTIPVTMRDMLHHTAAVSRGVKSAMVVGDMPFLSHQVSISQALKNAGRFIQTAGADAVKLEGGARRAPTVKALVENGIPVLGHIGLTPQNVLEFGGYKVQGRQPEQIEQLLRDALELEKAGAFAIVLECVPAEIGKKVSASVGVPIIGIGAGPFCDGQILVLHDLFGMPGGALLKFVKRYANLEAEMREALASFKRDVEQRTFPAEEHCYS